MSTTTFDPTVHPRGGNPANPGQFAAVNRPDQGADALDEPPAALPTRDEQFLVDQRYTDAVARAQNYGRTMPAPAPIPRAKVERLIAGRHPDDTTPGVAQADRCRRYVDGHAGKHFWAQASRGGYAWMTWHVLDDGRLLAVPDKQPEDWQDEQDFRQEETLAEQGREEDAWWGRMVRTGTEPV